jgi:large subunit ribosomal protein L18
MTCQLVDDTAGRTLFGFSTLDEKFLAKSKKGGTVEAARLLGKIFAEDIKSKGIKRVCFDRGGLLYHGRIKALAEALREGGIEF